MFNKKAIDAQKASRKANEERGVKGIIRKHTEAGATEAYTAKKVAEFKKKVKGNDKKYKSDIK